MFYRLRSTDGTASPFSAGAIIAPDGSKRPLAADDVHVEPLRSWRSPRTGIEYPVNWSLSIPAEGIGLSIAAVIPNQEIDLTVRYWEGAVDVKGSGPAGAIAGRGYLELAGY